MIPLVNLSRQHAEIADELDAAIKAVFRDNAFISGPYVKAFEEAFAKALDPSGATQVIGCSSGTSALSIVLEALGIGAGDEVIVPTHTFAATAELVRHVGAIPVFADIEPASYTVDPADVARKLTARTRAVVPVHIYGAPADLDALAAVLPQARTVAIIEDTAQGHLATWRGRSLGTIGTAGTFSFYPGKNLGACGDAGAISVKDPQLAGRMRKLVDHGRMSKYEHDMVGYNHRMDGLQGAILEAKLKHLPAWTARRRALAARYDAAFEPRQLKTIHPLEGGEAVYHLYVVEIANRDEVQAALHEAGIASGVHYPVPLHRQPAFKPWANGALPVTERVVERVLSLPICPHLADEEADRVIEVVTKVARA